MEMVRVKGQKGPTEARMPEEGRVPAGRCLKDNSQGGQGLAGHRASACAPRSGSGGDRMSGGQSGLAHKAGDIEGVGEDVAEDVGLGAVR